MDDFGSACEAMTRQFGHDAVVFTDDTKYVIDFAGKTAVSKPFKSDIVS